MEYISLIRYDIPELVVSLLEHMRGSQRTRGHMFDKTIFPRPHFQSSSKASPYFPTHFYVLKLAPRRSAPLPM